MSDIEEARRVLKIEAQALVDLAERLDERFERCGGACLVNATVR